MVDGLVQVALVRGEGGGRGGHGGRAGAGGAGEREGGWGGAAIGL